jgi:hypothetical protein
MRIVAERRHINSNFLGGFQYGRTGWHADFLAVDAESNVFHSGPPQSGSMDVGSMRQLKNRDRLLLAGLIANTAFGAFARIDTVRLFLFAADRSGGALAHTKPASVAQFLIDFIMEHLHIRP